MSLSATRDFRPSRPAALDAQKVVVQLKGKTKTTLQAIGWTDALVSYRPFLSYNELGSMMEFLYSLNRLNVATSRARCAVFVVASPRLMQLANALCRYREMATEFSM